MGRGVMKKPSKALLLELLQKAELLLATPNPDDEAYTALAQELREVLAAYKL